VALLATLWPAVALSQSAEPEASLTARVASAKAVFAIGELITLELEFRGRGGPNDTFSTTANSVAACATATQALQAYGSAAVKEPLIARLGVLKREWKGKEAELAAMENRHPGRPSNPDSPVVLENALVFALLSSARLDITEDDVARILASCVSPSCRGNVEAMAGVRRDTHRVGEQPPRQP
jgi:hypothetical protein